MASETEPPLGKTAFLKEFLKTHRDANEETINQAWKAAGNTDSISGSLVYKTRARLGLTRSKPTTARSASASTRLKSKSGPRPTRPTPPHPHDTQSAAGMSSVIFHDDEETLDELEESLEDLIQKVRNLGDKPDVVRALRRARRLLYRS